ncbi:MAG: hypothetical protein RLY93_18750 [Sumerlaeia bacterium]
MDYVKGTLPYKVMTHPSFRDLRQAVAADGIILVPVVRPPYVVADRLSYYCGYLDALGFAEADPVERARIFLLTCTGEETDDYLAEQFFESFLSAPADHPNPGVKEMLASLQERARDGEESE